MQIELKTFKEKLLSQLFKIINDDGQPESLNELHLFGSNRTDLCMHWSNIDLMFKYPHQNFVGGSNQSLSVIQKLLEKEQSKSQWMSNIRMVWRY